MEMHRPQRILLPARTGFIVFTFIGATLLNLMPWGHTPGAPDFVALVLTFWCVRQPRRVGMLLAWLFGIVMDIHNGALLGQHAVAYVVLAYGALTLSRRMQWFTLVNQALHVLPLFLLAQLVMAGVRVIAGNDFPGLGFFTSSLVQALLWPAVTILLLIPQKVPREKDDTHPI